MMGMTSWPSSERHCYRPCFQMAQWKMSITDLGNKSRMSVKNMVASKAAYKTRPDERSNVATHKV